MGVILTRDLLMSSEVDDVQPLTHARIGYRTLLKETGATLTASTAAVGYPASNVKREATDAWWKPTAIPATLTLTLPETRKADYIGIASHDLAGFTIKYEYNDGASWVEIEEFLQPDNSTIMLIHTEVLAAQYRLTISGTGDVPRVGVVYIGKALAMQQPIYGGFTPPISPDVETRGNQSDAGQFLGVSVIRKTQPFSASWQHLTAPWFRKNMLPFLQTFETRPAFVSWRPADFPDEVVYMWRTSNPSGSNMGIKDYMEVSIQGNGIGVAPDGRTL